MSLSPKQAGQLSQEPVSCPLFSLQLSSPTPLSLSGHSAPHLTPVVRTHPTHTDLCTLQAMLRAGELMGWLTEWVEGGGVVGDVTSSRLTERCHRLMAASAPMQTRNAHAVLIHVALSGDSGEGAFRCFGGAFRCESACQWVVTSHDCEARF